MDKSIIETTLIKRNREQSKHEISIKNIVIDYHIGKRKFKEKIEYLKRKKENLEDNLENIVKQIEYYIENISIIKEQINNICNIETIETQQNISFNTDKLNNYKRKIIDNNIIIKKLVNSHEKVRKELTNTSETLILNSKNNIIRDYFSNVSVSDITEELEKYENEVSNIIKNSKIFI